MRRVLLVLLVAAVLLLQVSFIPALHPLGVVPNLVLVLVVLVGLMGAATTALGVALAGGLMLDLTSGDDFGLRLGLLVLVALVTGLVHRAGLMLVGPTVALVLVAAATLVGQVTVLAGLAGSAGGWSAGAIMGTVVAELILNLGLVLVLRPLVRWTAAGETGLPETVRG